MKKLSLLLFMFLFVVGLTMAQRTVTGSVTDLNGEPLIGANVLISGTTTGTITDIDGSFSMEVPTDAQSLSISYTGFQDQDVSIFGLNNVAISMAEGELLEEIVVTGLGIKKEKKALGYGVSTISSDALEGRAEGDVARILRGKATGVDITQTSGIAGSGTNIIIRGYSSITGDNQPLFVVDGVPFNTSTNGNDPNNQGFNQGSATASSRFLDLDPNNISEISILKGLSATVLYGEAGRNGVILVTTKSGNAGASNNRGFEISVTQSIAQTEISNLPDYQNEFGNGFSGNFGWFFSNWGPSFSTRGSNGVAADGQIDHPLDQSQYNDDFPELIGADYEYKSYEPTEGFFTNGLSANTSINIDKAFKGGAINANYSYLSEDGFTKNKGEMVNTGGTNYEYVEGDDKTNNVLKHSLGLGGNFQLDNGLKIRSTFNFVTTDRVSPPAAAAFGSGPNAGNASLFSDVAYTPRSVDLNHLPFQSPLDGSQVYYRRGGAIQNPYWTLNNISNYEDVKRFFGTVDLQYPITDFLTAQYRVGIDQYSQKSTQEINKGGSQVPDGANITTNRLNTITDHVLNLLYDTQINEDLSLDGVIGFNGKRENQDYTVGIATNQFVFDNFNFSNFVDFQNYSFIQNENLLGLYATATIGFRNFLYIQGQARNDWTSTLEKANRSVFYPSVSVSFIPTEAVPTLQNNNIINYLKLRAGFGTSAGYPDPYQTRSVLDTRTNSYVGIDGTNLNTNTVANRLGNGALQAEKHAEFEFGVESRLLDNRIGIDFSYYNRQSTDLIVDLDLDPSSGYRNTTINAADVENKGVEIGLNINPVRGDFNWDFTLNFTSNRNIVKKIADGVDQVVIEGFSNLGNFAIPDEPYGIIQGLPYERNDAGLLEVQGDGNYLPGNEIAPIGNPNPNYTANWINNIGFKGLSLGWQFSYQDGGDIYSVTTATMLARGLTEDTNVDRFLPIIQPGVLASDSSTPNDIQGYIGDFFFRSYFFADEGTIFDATHLRLREVSIAYSLPKKLLESTPFGSASLVASGQNLWFNAPNFPVGVNFDPEVLSLGVGNGRGFDFFTGPTSKKYGVTLNLTF